MDRIGHLFDKYFIGNRMIKNHFVMAPVPSGMIKNEIIQDGIVDFYDSRSKDVGLVIIGAINIDSLTATNHPKIPYIRTENDLSKWESVNSQIHKNGAVSLAEIWHSGSSRKTSIYSNSYLTPSENKIDEHTLREVTLYDIHEVMDGFVDAAINAYKCGFDGVDIHAAHGSLLHDFLSEDVNYRKDEYGYHNGIHIINEIIDRIRYRLGKDFIISVRISNYKMYDLNSYLRKDEKELGNLIKSFSSNVDMLDVSSLHWQDKATPNSETIFSKFVKENTHVPVITVGQIGFKDNFYSDLPKILQRITKNPYGSLLDMQSDISQFNNIEDLYNDFMNRNFDLVAIGRPLLVNPRWLMEVKKNNND